MKKPHLAIFLWTLLGPLLAQEATVPKEVFVSQEILALVAVDTIAKPSL